MLVTGQIHRATPFERGFPIHYARIADQWQQDPLIHDDQAVVVHVKGKGLVILTGCGHTGAVNTIHHAQQLTGIQQVYAVIGGFHLSGALFEPIIPPTIAALKEISPALIVPAQCTGWKATHALARELPEAFVPNSVGRSLWAACRSSRPAGLFSFGLLDGLSVRLRRPYLRETPAGFGLERLATVLRYSGIIRASTPDGRIFQGPIVV